MPYKGSIPRICHNCGAEFFVFPSRVKQDAANYCGTACFFESVRAGSGPIIDVDGTARIPLRARGGSVRAYTIIDAADADFAGQRTWSLIGSYAGCNEIRNGQKYGLKLHRELMGLAPGDGFEVDHINRDKLDNRRSNLRVIPKNSQAQNIPNRTGSMSIYRGVTKVKGYERWRARVVNPTTGERIHLGGFSTEAAAGEAAREARLKLVPYAID